MNIREESIKKINQLPDKLIPEVNILLDFFFDARKYSELCLV